MNDRPRPLPSDERQTERDGQGGSERGREYVEDTLFVYNDYLRKAKTENKQRQKQQRWLEKRGKENAKHEM